MTDFLSRVLAKKKKQRSGKKLEYSQSDELISDPKRLRVHASLAILTKDIGEILDKSFPGWAWIVSPDERNGIINIFCLNLHDEWGYTIRTVEIHNDPKRRLAYQAGKEILERFGITPGPMRQRLEELRRLKTDRKGRAIVVDAWDRMTRQQKEQQRLREKADRIERAVMKGVDHNDNSDELRLRIKEVADDGTK